MKKINWKDIVYFDADDFSEDPNSYCETEMIYRLDYFRMKYEQKIWPSPVSGATARFDGSKTSQHYVDITKNIYSKALDVFPEGYPIDVYNHALSLRLFNGIGIYLDTKGPDGLPWVMFHFDMRNVGYKYGVPIIWIVEKVFDSITQKTINKYRYPQQPQNSHYWSLLKDDRLYKFKEKGSV
jgi:hypothetical protein